MPKLTWYQKWAAGAAIFGIIATIIAIVQFFRGTHPTVQQSGITNVQGDVTASTGGVAAGPGSTIHVVNSRSSQPSAQKADVTLYVECRSSALPTNAPDHRINVLQLQPIPAESGGGGLGEYWMAGNADFIWPKTEGMPLMVQRCQITNHGKDAIFNVEMALQLNFMEALVDKEQHGVTRSGQLTLTRPWLIYVGRIEPGSDRAFSFYIWNISRLFAQVNLPDNATGQLQPENARRPVQVVHPIVASMWPNPFVEAKNQ